MKNGNNLSVWNHTWSPVTGLRRDFDHLFEDWFAPRDYGLRTSNPIIPACDVEEAEDHYLLNLELAGVRKEDIKLEIIGNQITISGERRNEARKEEKNHVYSERRFGSFQRILTLPSGLASEDIAANYQDGILQVILPKAETAKPRQIRISSGMNFGIRAPNNGEKEELPKSRINQHTKVAS